MPWRDNISCSVNRERSCADAIPLHSNARLAGAENRERNPSVGFRSASQVGQVLQSLLL